MLGSSPFGGVGGGLSPEVYVPNTAAEAADRERESLLSFSPLSVHRVALGLDHSLCVGLKGQQPQLFAWGRNRDNALGLGIETRDRVFPGLVPFFAKHAVFSVAAGSAHSLVLLKRPNEGGGKVFSVGLGTGGRLGYPMRVSSSETAAAAGAAAGEEEEDEGGTWFAPTYFKIRFPDRARIARIASGAAHSLAVSDCGFLFAWGQGCYGALGTGDTACRYTPVRVQVGRRDAFVTHAAAGAKHSLCCLADGTCWSWGAGASGRLGLGHTRGALLPVMIESLLQQQIVFVSAGESHSAALDTRGCTYTWGSGAFFRLGHGDEADCPTPRIIESLGGVPIMQQIACGTFHTLAVSLSGVLFAWGSGLGLGCGVGEDGIGGSSPQPRQVPGIAAPVLQAAAAAYHSAAVTVQGDLLCWGVGGASRLGSGDQSNHAFPAFVADLRNRVFVSDLRAMLGAQVGDRGGDISKPVSPLAAPAGGAANWKLLTVACGGSHTLAVTLGGSLWVWGSNEKGQLGVGSEETEDEHEPFLLDCFSLPVKRIACGDAHCLVVTAHGNVLSWGSNEMGQLGLGSTRPAYTPQGVSSLRNAIDVFAAADYSACITSGINGAEGAEAAAAAGAAAGAWVYAEQLQQSGELWLWGSAESGKLGLGEKILGGAITVPHSVSMPSSVSKVALGQSHVLALTARGFLYAWGAGFYGRLGLGSSANVYTAALVEFPTPIRANIAAGSMQSMCLTEDGEIWVWGRREYLCAAQHILTPKLFLQLEGPEGVSKAKSIAACGEHCLAVTVDGRVYGWGENANLQACCGSRMAQSLDRPELVQGLPEPAEAIFTGPEHTIVKLKNGELYAWGCTVGGRLGIGWKRKQLQQTPALVVPHWADPAVSSSAGGNAFAFEAEEDQLASNALDRIQLAPGVSESAVQDFLSRLPFTGFAGGVGGPSWAQLQELLQQEEFECRADFLKSLEDGLISVLGRDIDYLLSLKDTEKETRQLEIQYQTLMINVAARTRCGLASASDVKTPQELQTKLTALQPLAFYLQQQPAYLLRLLFSVKTKKEKALTLPNQVYLELEDRRISGLFCCLMRAVAKQEVAEVSDLMSCMDPDSSNLVELVRMFALRGSVLVELSKFLLDLRDPNSLVTYLSRIEVDFCYEIDDLLAKQGGFEPNRRRHSGAAGAAAARVPFGFGGPEAVLAAVFPGWISTTPVGEAPSCGFDQLPERMSRQLKMVAELLRRLSREDYKEMATGFLLQQLRFEFWNATALMLRHQMDVDDDLDVELTMDLFASHYDVTEHYVTWATDDLLSLVNVCKKYESYLNLSAHDPIAKVVHEVSGGKTPPFSDELVAECEAAKSSQSFKVDHRFLLTEKTLVYCSLTDAPVPQRLALRQRAQIQDGQRVLAVLIRYVPPDPSDFRVQLAECLRLSPRSAASSPERLAAEFIALSEHFASLETPDFAAAALFEKVAGSLNRGIIESKGLTQIDCMRWIAEGILERRNHRKYLGLGFVQRHVESIQSLRREYELGLKNRVETLKEALHAADTLAVEQPIEIAARRFNFNLSFPSLRKKQPTQRQEDFLLSLTFKYSVLLQREAAPSLPPEMLLDVYLTFTLLPQEGWRVTVTHRTPKLDRQLAQQELSAEEILMLKNANPRATLPLARTPGCHLNAHLEAESELESSGSNSPLWRVAFSVAISAPAVYK
ncbi:hypothetical protein Efla_001167 [Eimeria flavescens]